MIIELLKYIYNNIFIKFFRYWLIIFIFYVLYLFISYFNSNVRTYNISSKIENSIYIGNGVAINKKDILVNKKIIDDNCFGIVTKKQSNIYILANHTFYPVIIYAQDNINNMYILRLARYEESLPNYTLLQIDEPTYTVNKRLLVPLTMNNTATFNFKDIRIVGTKDNNIFLANRNLFNKKYLIGAPLFSKNYLLQGIIKEENSNYLQKTSKDSFIESIGLQNIYSANNLQTIKYFLDNNKIKYSTASENINIASQPINPTKSVVNVVCLKKY